MRLAEQYMSLFVHRRDVFAEQQPNGAYYPVRREFTEADLAEHLSGISSYGVYTTDPDGHTIKYLMFDLDTHDVEAQIWLRRCCTDLVPGSDKTCLLYETSGNKGTHVWLFFDEPVEAALARRWVARDFLPTWEEKARPNRWPLEVFPKQDSVPEGGFGNLVKLPLGRHAVSGVFSSFAAVPEQGWARDVQTVVPLSVSLVPRVDPAEVPRPGGDARRLVAPSGGNLPTTPFPCVDAILREGVGRGVRDNAMFHLALYFFGHGVDEDLAYEACIRANENFDPPLSEREVEDKVSSAYRGRYASARCGTDWLVDVCPGPCRSGWSVKQVDVGTLSRAEPGDVVEVEVVARSNEEGRSRVTVTHPDAINTPTFVVGR